MRCYVEDMDAPLIKRQGAAIPVYVCGGTATNHVKNCPPPPPPISMFFRLSCSCWLAYPWGCCIGVQVADRSSLPNIEIGGGVGGWPENARAAQEVYIYRLSISA